MRPLTSSLLGLAFVLGLATSGCTSTEDTTQGGEGAQAQVAGAREIGVSTGAPRVLEGVWHVRSIPSPDELTIRLYELGGGDPAINGTFLELAIEDKVWELPSNILSVTSATSRGAGQLEIVGVQQTIDGESGDPKSSPWKSVITYQLDGGNVSSKLDVKTNDAPESITAKTDASATFLSSVYKVTTAEAEGLHARVFEAGGGDPAMNGARLYLALMSYPDVGVFDLGLDVSSVSKVEVDPKSRRITILGNEDTIDRDGAISSRPFRKTFAVSEVEGTPTSVQLAP